jgi:uncharacterized cupin superfamily protein
MNWRVSLTVLVWGLTGMVAAAGTKDPAVITIPAAALAGKGLESSNPEDFNTPHLQEREPQGKPPGGMKLVRAGQLNVAVFEINGGRNHFDYFLGDELVLVVAGEVTLTTDKTHRSQIFRKGERFFVPQGWQGDWQSSRDYRELACVSDAWFSHLGDKWQPAQPPAADLDVSRVDKDAFGAATGEGSINRAGLNNGADLRVSLLSGKAAATRHVDALEHDQLFQLAQGSLTVVPGDGSPRQRFAAGASFILTAAFRGDLLTPRGFEAVVAEPGKP